MEDYLLTVMKRASIFMVLAQAVIHFRPNPSYEKYFRFLVGIMTVVILAVPMMELTRSGIDVRYEESLKAYERRVEEALSGQSVDALVSRDLYLSEMEGEIKTKLNNYTKQKGYSVDTVTIMWEEEGDALSGLQIALVRDGDPDPEKEEIAIEPVQIAPVRTSEEASKEDSDEASDKYLSEAEKLRSGIAQELSVGEEKVEVKIVE